MSRFSHFPHNQWQKNKIRWQRSSSLLEHLEEKEHWTAHKLKWRDEIPHLPPTRTKSSYEIWMESDVEAVGFIAAAFLGRPARWLNIGPWTSTYARARVEKEKHTRSLQGGRAGALAGTRQKQESSGKMKAAFSGDHSHFSPLIP